MPCFRRWAGYVCSESLLSQLRRLKYEAYAIQFNAWGVSGGGIGARYNTSVA
jgi:hypothetical protein